MFSKGKNKEKGRGPKGFELLLDLVQRVYQHNEIKINVPSIIAYEVINRILNDKKTDLKNPKTLAEIVALCDAKNSSEIDNYKEIAKERFSTVSMLVLEDYLEAVVLMIESVKKKSNPINPLQGELETALLLAKMN